MKRFINKSTAILFCRAPELGKVKRRLAKEIGDQKALSIYKALLEEKLELLPRLKFEARIYLEGANAPEFSSFEVKPQSGGDLGARMLAAFDNEFSEGVEWVVLFGSDVQELKEEDINQALIIWIRLICFGACHGWWLLFNWNEKTPYRAI